MADVLSKTNLVSSLCVGYRKLQRHNNSSFIVTKSCRIPSRVAPHALKSKTMLLTSGFLGKSVVLQGNLCKSKKLVHKLSIEAQTGLRLKNAQNWWDKGLQPNMKEVTSAQDLVDSLMNAGDKLVIVDFFSPGCGGCKALHPKICQMAEMNPDVIFLHVNYEEHKSMCHSLNVHVLPFFRFYRGAQGRVCSFSCTNATIKKFKDALAKHTPDRCSLGPTKGLEEKELIALAANRDLKFTYTPKPEESSSPAEEETAPATAAPSQSPPISTLPLPRQMTEDLKEKTLATSGR